MRNSERFVALDGLRGVFAIAVVLHHYSQLQGGHLMRSAWLAVDAFFILSGFVIALSYTHRILEGLSFFEFFKIRLLRLYPMYFMGLLLGVAALWAYGPSNLSLTPDVFKMLFVGIFSVPYFGSFPWESGNLLNQAVVFPFNDPAWSLFFEIFANILFFVTARIFFIGRRSVVILMLLLLLCYVISINVWGLHSGYSQNNFWGGFARVVFHFSLGCCIFKMQKVKVDFHRRWIYILLVVALLIFNVGNVFIICSMLLFVAPLIVFVGSKTAIASNTFEARLLTWLGGISFPLYITHYPLYRLWEPIMSSMVERGAVSLFLSTLLSVLVAHFLMLLEPRVRVILSTCLTTKKLVR
ncbi:acyltransferase [Rhodoferax saidenbachensis]|uniref:Peptidoglycan/LPS O-acetylase OafA/YrhL n=1 Tax=Rhodoferax saidenbachensis TaxID=1484693 RepID=A0ABU1ZJ99_9BURK|nr:acyltransferase [Rhodoferax saidenbachensis]MDR7305629.1 peptidoglycan/LPS O-acetylase OafA/YrhL [Rhodoferax saidenbachensis]